MALARVVTFDGVNSEHISQMTSNIEGGERPEGLNATEMMILHDPEAEKAYAIVFFDNEDDYQQGHEILDAMPRGDTPGNRTSVTKTNVALRMTPVS
jgi:hypothetical protein